MAENGKGSKARPFVITKEKFYNNFENNFPVKPADTSSTTDDDHSQDRKELEWAELYFKELQSGMFWEWYPKLSGVWLRDKDMWISRKQFPDR